MGIYQDKSIFELPFLMYSDDYLQFMVEHRDEILEMMPPATEPSRPTAPTNGTVPNTSIPTVPTTTVPAVPTVPGTDPTDHTGTLPPVTTVPPITQTPTTQTPTTQTPTTQPPVTQPTKPKDEPNFDFPAPGVDDSWFENTLFIGDSRVVGLREYARSGNADYFCGVGMTVFGYQNEEHWDKNISKQTLKSLLASKKYDKIIINFGLNESGYPDVSFQIAYKAFVEMVRPAQPDAKIILQNIMSVTSNNSKDGYWMTPAHIAKRSAFIKSLADGEDIFYIDCDEYFADSEGYLFSSLTNDGYHPTGKGYRHWRDWIAYAVGTLGI
jgi:lysophospholipase L1-like esterase